MATEDNKAIVHRIIDELWNGWNLSVGYELYASDFVDHALAPTQPSGHEGLRHVFLEWRSAFADWHVTIEEMIAERDLVVANLKASGTHTGDFQGIAPTGKRITMAALEMWRVADGKVVEFWAGIDRYDFQLQLQAIPAIGREDLA